MLTFNDVTVRPPSRVKRFSLTIDKPGVEAVLCPNVTYLDDLTNVLLDRSLLTDGEILLDGHNFYQCVENGQAQIISEFDALYGSLTVMDNVLFSLKSFFRFGKRQSEIRFENLLKETGFYLDGRQKVHSLTREQKKIAELLKCFASPIKLLVLRDVTGFLSYKNFSLFLNLLQSLVRRGATVVFFSCQWEEVIKVAESVTVISHGENYGRYTVAEMQEDSSRIFSILMGGHAYQTEPSQQDAHLRTLRLLNEQMQQLSECYDLRKALQSYALHLRNELHASNQIVYLLDQEQRSLICVTALDDADSEKLFLTRETIQTLSEQEGMHYFAEKEAAAYIPRADSIQGLWLTSYTVNSDVKIVLQSCFQHSITPGERERLLVQWIAHEIAIVVENSRLMGSSALLLESHHRIKNNLQIIISLVELERATIHQKIVDEKTCGEAESMMDAICGRIRSVAQVHDLLCKGKQTKGIVEMFSIVRNVAQCYEDSATIRFHFDKILLPHSRATSIALVVNELISNSIKHNPHMAGVLVIEITATISEDGTMCQIHYRDNGSGYQPDFRFESSTGVGGMLIQSVICNELAGNIRAYTDGGANALISIPMECFSHL